MQSSRIRRILRNKWAASAVVSALLYLLSGWWELNFMPPSNWDGPLVSIQGGMVYYMDWEAPTQFRNLCSLYQCPDAGLSIQRTKWWRGGIPVPAFHLPFPVKQGLWFDNRTSFTDQFEVPLWPIPLALGIIAIARSPRFRRLPSGFCWNCGYNLTGNTSGVCPECGDKACPPAMLADSECGKANPPPANA